MKIINCKLLLSRALKDLTRYQKYTVKYILFIIGLNGYRLYMCIGWMDGLGHKHVGNHLCTRN